MKPIKAQITGGRVVTLGNPISDGVYSIEKWREKRSNQQNKLLHVVFKEAAHGMSIKLGKTVSPELAKAVLKKRFLTENIEGLGEYETPTSKLKTDGCVKFIEECVQYSAEHCRHYISLPDDWMESVIEQ